MNDNGVRKIARVSIKKADGTLTYIEIYDANTEESSGRHLFRIRSGRRWVPDNKGIFSYGGVLAKISEALDVIPQSQFVESQKTQQAIELLAELANIEKYKKTVGIDNQLKKRQKEVWKSVNNLLDSFVS